MKVDTIIASLDRKSNDTLEDACWDLQSRLIAIIGSIMIDVTLTNNLQYQGHFVDIDTLLDGIKGRMSKVLMTTNIVRNFTCMSSYWLLSFAN